MDGAALNCLGKRLKAVIHAAGAALVIPLVGGMAVTAGLRALFPPMWSDGAMFSWGTGSGLVGLLALLAMTFGTIGAAFYGGVTQRLKSVLILAAVAGIGGGLMDFILARDHGVGVWPDRIEMRNDGSDRLYRPSDVVSVETACGFRSSGPRRRRNRYATVDYALVFADGWRLDLSGTQPAKRADGLEWLRNIESFDQTWGAEAPKVEPLDSEGFPATRPLCAQDLRAELSDDDFAIARRLLDLSDDHMRRLGLGPREAW